MSYDDGSNTVFIATLKSAQGYLTSSNQVTYRDAFTGFKADLVCTYRRGGFECDLVFRQQPPTPGDFGLDDTFSTLQLVTEFSTRKNHSKSRRRAMTGLGCRTPR